MHIDTSKKHCKSSTLEKSLLPYITANSITGHATQVQNTTLYSDGTTHSKQHCSKWVPPNRTITVALDMSKVFDTINIHTLIRKLLQTNISDTSIELIANYIKGRKADTTYRNHTSSQRQFKTGIPQGGVFSPTLFNIYTADIQPPRAPVQVMAYADVIPSHLHAQVQPKNTYNHTYIKFLSGQNKTISH